MGTVVDAGAGVGSGTFNRLATVINYEFDSLLRQGSNPLQSMWDLLSGTTVIEQLSAVETIVMDDAHLYDKGPYFGREAECFTGSDAFGGRAAATTTGHTIRISGTDAPSRSLVAHEMQHVYDIENVGGVGFYVSYGVFSVACRCYEDNPWEKRAYNITDNFPASKPRGIFSEWSISAWNWLTGNWVSPVGPVIASSPQPAPSSSVGFSSSGQLPKSGPYW